MSDWVEVDLRPARLVDKQVRLSIKGGSAYLKISRAALDAAGFTSVSHVGLMRNGNLFRIVAKEEGKGERLGVVNSGARFSAGGRTMRNAGFRPGIVNAHAEPGLIEFDATQLVGVATRG